MPVGQIGIYLNHHRDDAKRPKVTTCQDSRTSGRKGCGMTIHVYITLKNEKPFPLDGPPIILGQYAREDGAIIGQIDTANMHRLTCPHMRTPAPAAPPDFKAAAGGSR